MKIAYSSNFLRQFNKLEKFLADEVYEKIELFKDTKNHEQLKVHKLHGRLRGHFSFSVNYRIRVFFEYTTSSEATMLAIGGHDAYR